jgi:hypothetical protein
VRTIELAALKLEINLMRGADLKTSSTAEFACTSELASLELELNLMPKPDLKNQLDRHNE